MWSEIITGISIPLFSVGLYKLGKSSVRRDIIYTQGEITDTIKKLEEIGREDINKYGMYIKFTCTPVSTI